MRYNNRRKDVTHSSYSSDGTICIVLLRAQSWILRNVHPSPSSWWYHYNFCSKVTTIWYCRNWWISISTDRSISTSNTAKLKKCRAVSCKAHHRWTKRCNFWEKSSRDASNRTWLSTNSYDYRICPHPTHQISTDTFETSYWSAPRMRLNRKICCFSFTLS